mmetsp:Transcript_36234/g.78858  ORF Transcript_36234/g.78858 Transcript_36234/m.78858 type:complete len:245 (-) Transcript_36234:239-973(-)
MAASTDHYAVLGVSKTASLSEIKAAHRQLALRLHPDKRSSSGTATQSRNGKQERPTAATGMDEDDKVYASKDAAPSSAPAPQDTTSVGHNNGEQVANVADANFRRIQLAWECLRDPLRRKQYDEEMDRTKERVTSKVDKAVGVRLSEMECEICEVEVDDCSTSDGDDLVDGGSSGRTSNHSTDDQNKGGSGDCQQQRVYIHTCRCGDDFEILEDELTGSGKDNVFECRSCCLLIRVEVDTAREN